MTVKQIREAAQAYTGQPIEPTQAVAAVNEAMRILGEAAELYAQIVKTTSTDNEWVDLPADAISPVRVVDEDGRVVRNVGQMGQRLLLPLAGTYTLHYRRMPTPVTSDDDTPEVHPLFHQALVTYLKGWWKLYDDEDSADGKAHLKQFSTDAQAALIALRRRRYPQSWSVER